MPKNKKTSFFGRFTSAAKMSDEKIETKELALLAVMLKGTPYVVPIVSTIKKRS